MRVETWHNISDAGDGAHIGEGLLPGGKMPCKGLRRVSTQHQPQR